MKNDMEKRLIKDVTVNDVTLYLIRRMYIYLIRITCRIVTPNLYGVIILQVESYRVTIVQVVNICLNYTMQDIIYLYRNKFMKKKQ